jgi:hypothetical protein
MSLCNVMESVGISKIKSEIRRNGERKRVTKGEKRRVKSYDSVRIIESQSDCTLNRKAIATTPTIATA